MSAVRIFFIQIKLCVGTNIEQLHSQKSIHLQAIKPTNWGISSLSNFISMKSTFSQLKTASVLLLLLCFATHVFSQKKLVLNLDLYPVFIMPESTLPHTSFPFGGGVAADLMIGKHLKHGIYIGGGLASSYLWFKETDIRINWGNAPEGTFYDRKFRMNDLELKAMFSKTIKVGKSEFVPTVGAGHSWFSGTEKYVITEGNGENLGKNTGSLGNSFNLHFGLGFHKSMKNGRASGLKPVFNYRFGKIESPNQNFATKSFRPHTLAVHINFLGLFFKNKSSSATKE
jgi:hypothetical protein